MDIESSIFLPDRGSSAPAKADLNPKHWTISIQCPHCGKLGTFAPIIQGLSITKSKKIEGGQSGVTYIATVRVCPNQECRGLVFTHSESAGTTICFPPETVDFNQDEIPTKLVSTMSEAIKCHSAGAYRATALLVRRLMEELCEETHAKGPNLFKRLEALREKITLPQELFDAMHELKSLGNDAAHVESKAYDEIGKEEAEISLELAKEILKSRYQYKGILDRLRSRKKQPE